MGWDISVYVEVQRPGQSWAPVSFPGVEVGQPPLSEPWNNREKKVWGFLLGANGRSAGWLDCEGYPSDTSQPRSQYTYQPYQTFATLQQLRDLPWRDGEIGDDGGLGESLEGSGFHQMIHSMAMDAVAADYGADHVRLLIAVG